MRKILLTLSVFAGFTVSAQVYYSASTSAEFTAGSIYDADGDSANWGVLNTSVFTATTAEITAMGECLYSQSWDSIPLTPDNFYFTPVINMTSASGTINLSWKVASPDNTASTFFAENYSVYVFDGFSNITAALTGTPVHSGALTAGETVFSMSYPISNMAGVDSLIIAFRHHNCTDQDLILLDDILVSGTNGLNENFISASVYPNPANDVLNINLNGIEIENITILSLDGKVVISKDVNTVNGIIDISSLNAGMYMYKVTSKSGQFAKHTFVKK
jgi:hypothetical protein